MSRPPVDLRNLSKLVEPDSDDERNFFDKTIAKITRNKSSNNLILARPATITTVEEEKAKTPEIKNPPETFKTEELYDKPAFKPIHHSPKISPSSIPNPSPSVSTKPDTFPNYGFNNLYSIPGYSAFQAYQGLHTPPKVETPKKSPEFIPFPPKKSDAPSPPKKPKTPESDEANDKSVDEDIKLILDEKITLSHPVLMSDYKTNPPKLPSKSPDLAVKHELRQENKLEYKPCPAQFKPLHLKSEDVQLNAENLTTFKTPVRLEEKFKYDTQNTKTESLIKPLKLEPTSLFKTEPTLPSSVSETPNDFKTEKGSVSIRQGHPYKQESNEIKPVSPSFKTDPLRQYFKNDSVSQQYSDAVKSEPSLFKTEALRVPHKSPSFNTPEQLRQNSTVHYGHDREPFKQETLTQLNDTHLTESKMSITSLSQGSGATVTIPTPQDKKKSSERFSLKTSIPISKIDIKCVGNPPDSFQSTQNKMPPDKQIQNLNKKPPDSPVLNESASVPFSPTFQSKDTARVEIQSDIVIKSAINEPKNRVETPKSLSLPVSSNSISTLINAAEAISNNDAQLWKLERNPELQSKDLKEQKYATPTGSVLRPAFSPRNTETKISFTNTEGVQINNEPKNQILFIQNKNATNPKMFLTISQPQNPQVLLQRSNFESKNLHAPSRLSSLSKKSKEEVVQKQASKVVALKRLHQENCDENDFENLITENQIYGNKIVVKEKSQGTSQEQDLKKPNNMKINEILNPKDTNNVVIQPVYFSNVHFPPNLMMINNSKGQQLSEQLKITNKIRSGEVKMPEWNKIICSDANIMKPKNTVVSKEIHVLKSNSVLQTLAKQNKPDLLLQSNQKVIMNPQILYQVPMLVETDSQKFNTPFINQDYTKFLHQNKKDLRNEQQKTSDKLYIACPYQMDSKLQPKIVITNIRPKITKIDEISALDTYEKRRRMRRLKYLTSKERDKESKTEFKKTEKVDLSRNIITPDKMKEEICKEFAKTKNPQEDLVSDTDSEYDENDLKEYEDIIEEYNVTNRDSEQQKEFLAHFNLATLDDCKDRLLDKEERSLHLDSVASAFISIGRIDRLPGHLSSRAEQDLIPEPAELTSETLEDDELGKVSFMSQMKLGQVTSQYKEDYEKAWKEILSERRRRDGAVFKEPYAREAKPDKMTIDTNGQLQILTEIKKSVNENNNLIKKRLDPDDTLADADTIHALAEKNFSELSKLSKMADRSVKLYSGNSKRDLNPGFESENIKKSEEMRQPFQSITIPNISKIISLKTVQEPTLVNSTQATSMDEPKNSAAGLRDDSVYDFTSPSLEEKKEFEELILPWPGLETVMKSYKLYEEARKKELHDLRARNTQLRVQCALANRTAAREAELARSLFAERQSLANDEIHVRHGLSRLIETVNFVRKYQ